jgi:pyrimidine-nucleoside phosphorylase
MVEAQGGDVSVIDHPEAYPVAPFQCDMLAPAGVNFAADTDALLLGQASITMGAGRQVAEDDVDALSGLWLHKVVGEPVQEGDVVHIGTVRNGAIGRDQKAQLSEKSICTQPKHHPTYRQL